MVVDLTCLQTALDMSRDATLIADLSGNIVFANRSARGILGDSLVQSSLSEVVRNAEFRSADDTDQVLTPDAFPAAKVLEGSPEAAADIAKVVGNRGSEDIRFYHASATRVNGDSSAPVITIVLQDVTAVRQAGEDLFLRDRAMAAAAEGITISDRRLPDNPLIYVNDGFENMTGYTRQEVIGRNCRFLQGPESNESARAEIRSAIEGNRACIVELKNFRKDGTAFWNRLSITPIRDASGVVTHFVGVQSDITERVESEQRLQKLTGELRQLNDQLLRDLRAAARIQRAQLPSPSLQVPGMRVAWFFESCDALAGDMLNIVQLDDDRTALYVLDVSGHGTGSALLSTSVSRLLQPGTGSASLVYGGAPKSSPRPVMNPARVIEELNKTYTWEAESNQFFTILYAVVTPRTQQFRFVCAGHPSPIIVSSDGRHQTFKSHGLPVGIAEESYNETSACLNAEDRVYFYSDGVVEAMNRSGALFGESRLIDVVKTNFDLDLDASVLAVKEALIQWRDGEPLQDDMTLLAFELA